MAEDREVLREIWEGRLPVCFTMAADEVSSPTAPDPFYLMIPRMTYFPLIIDKVCFHNFRILFVVNLSIFTRLGGTLSDPFHLTRQTVRCGLSLR